MDRQNERLECIKLGKRNSKNAEIIRELLILAGEIKDERKPFEAKEETPEPKFEVRMPTVQQLVQDDKFLTKWSNKNIDSNEKNAKILNRKKQREQFIRQMREKSLLAS